MNCRILVRGQGLRPLLFATPKCVKQDFGEIAVVWPLANSSAFAGHAHPRCNFQCKLYRDSVIDQSEKL
jgi:hypothetical protein